MTNYKAFPLHLHWDGGIPARELFSYSKKKSIELLLPEKDKDGKKIEYSSRRDRVIRNVNALEKFLDITQGDYGIFERFDIPINFMQSHQDMIMMAKAHAKYLKSEKADYAETRFAPSYHAKKGLSMEEVVEAAIEGFYAAKEDFGVDARLILCIPREIESSEGIKIADLAIKMNKRFPKHVLGIDLACYEPPFPPERHKKAFEKTFDTPLKRTVHAGEMCDEETNLKNIRTAIYDLRADGLGHAVPLYRDKRLVEEVVKRRIRIESCPVSNKIFGHKPEDLHLGELVDKGVLVTINPDDPAMIGNCTIKENFELAEKMYGAGFVKKAAENSVNSAWGLSEGEKKDYLAAHKDCFGL